MALFIDGALKRFKKIGVGAFKLVPIPQPLLICKVMKLPIKRYDYKLVEKKKTEKGTLVYLEQNEYIRKYKKVLGVKIPYFSILKIRTKGVTTWKGDKEDKWKIAHIIYPDKIKIGNELSNKKLIKFLNKNYQK